MPNPRPIVSSVLRFDLAIQRNHFFVYTLALGVGFVGHLLGVFPAKIAVAIAIWAIGCGMAALLYTLYKRGVDRRILNPIWMTSDLLLVTGGVYATGGINSPWFIWYVATSSAAAFASDKKTTLIISGATSVAYCAMLILMGQATLFNDVMLIAMTRMLYLFGASFFFLVGIANLQEKRLRIRQLEAEESRKVAELTRLAEELAGANRRIQETDRLKSQFIANMSHELRTPMNSIIGFSEILSERLEGRIEPKHLGFLRHIHSSGQHLLGMINDILDLSKIEAGKMEIFPEIFPVVPVIESVCHVMRGTAKANRTFVVEADENLPRVETDLAKFKQILFNLMSNAVKFSPPDTPIAIRASVERDALTVSVRDEGVGIDPSHHATVFEEFRQVDGSVRREFGGTGLGLALVKKFVELQGGTIGVESRLGEGSTFTFTLPIRSQAAVVTPVAEMPRAEEKRDRVLVVEDDANAYELISSVLGSAGFLPIRARHGDEALRMARETQPIAVTLDVVLPGVDGWEVLKRLKNDASTRELPVVIVSMVDNRDLGIALGADDYFVKPVDRDRLLERLREIKSRPPEGPNLKILVIDDDAAVHELLREELSSAGFSIASASSGQEGMRAAVDDLPDVIILDLMMPGMSGFEVAVSLKEDHRTATIPILVLTSKEVSSDERELLQSNVSGFVRKGMSVRDQLVRELRRVTESA
jgi:signal transduction histidine kinase/DNA-binding response OmpR family regulator